MASFLVVDDEALVCRSVANLLEPHGSSRCATSVAEAERCIDDGAQWDGFIIDVALGDGSGIDVLAAARRRHVATPAVVFSGRLDRDVINRANALGARFLCKPFGGSELAPFLSDVMLRLDGSRPRCAAEQARHRWGLSPRETEILAAVLLGRSRSEYLASSGISENTYKTHVRRLLDKTDYENLASLAIDLLRE